MNDGLARYATGDRQVFRRRTGGWEVELLPGWDAVEDILGAALVSREPRREGAAFRSNINVVESPEILPEDLYTYSEQQAELLREAGVEPHDLMVRLPDENERSLKPGQMAVLVQSRSNIQGAIVEQETIWVGLGSACLIFTLMAEEAEYEAKQEAIGASCELHLHGQRFRPPGDASSARSRLIPPACSRRPIRTRLRSPPKSPWQSRVHCSMLPGRQPRWRVL